MRRFFVLVLSLVFILSLTACDTREQASVSDPKPESIPSSVSGPAPETSSSEPSPIESEPEKSPAPESPASSGDAADAADGEEDPEPEGRPEIWMGTFDDLSPVEQMEHWSEEEITRLMTEIAAQLYQKDEVLTGLTPVLRQGGGKQYSYGIMVSDKAEGYFAYQNDAGEDVAFRLINYSVRWVESKRRYFLEMISFEEWEQE